MQRSQTSSRGGARALPVAQPHYHSIVAAVLEAAVPRTSTAQPDGQPAAPKIVIRASKPVAADAFPCVVKPAPPPVAAPAPAAPLPKVELATPLSAFLKACPTNEELSHTTVTVHHARKTCSQCLQAMMRRRAASEDGDAWVFRCKECGTCMASGVSLPIVAGDLALAATRSPLLVSSGRPEPKQLLFVVDHSSGSLVLDPVTLRFRDAGAWDRSLLFRVLRIGDDGAVEIEPVATDNAGAPARKPLLLTRTNAGDLQLWTNPDLKESLLVKWRLPVKGAQIGEFIEKSQRKNPLAMPLWFQVDAATGRQTLVLLGPALQAALADPTNADGLFDAVAAAVVARGWFLEPLQPGSPPGSERVPLVDKTPRVQQLRGVLSQQLAIAREEALAAAAPAV